MTFDPKKPVQTRGGSPARIVDMDYKQRPGERPKILAIVKESKSEAILVCRHNGRLLAGDTQLDEHPRDLINIPEEITVFANIYRNSQGHIYGFVFETEDEAVKGCAGGQAIYMVSCAMPVKVTLT